MDILFVMLMITLFLSWRPLTRALPFESFLAFMIAGLAMTFLLVTNRLL